MRPLCPFKHWSEGKTVRLLSPGPLGFRTTSSRSFFLTPKFCTVPCVLCLVSRVKHKKSLPMDTLGSDRTAVLKESLRSFVHQVLKHFHCTSMERLDAWTSEGDSRGDRIEHERHKGTHFLSVPWKSFSSGRICCHVCPFLSRVWSVPRPFPGLSSLQSSDLLKTSKRTTSAMACLLFVGVNIQSRLVKLHNHNNYQFTVI